MEPYEVVYALLIGLCLGSFANVLIYRLPIDKSVIVPSSSCFFCGTKLKFYNNIPILSFLLQQGKSSCCKKDLPKFYIFVEAICGFIFLISVWKVGFGIFGFLAGLIFVLYIALSMIDINHLEVPDSLNLAILTLSFFSYGNYFYNIQNALLVAGGMSFLRFYLSYLIKKEAMGEGDIIVGGTMGALLGIKGAFLGLFLSAIFAIPIILLIKYILKKEPIVPFIPFLLLGSYVVFIFDAEIFRLLGI